MPATPVTEANTNGLVSFDTGTASILEACGHWRIPSRRESQLYAGYDPYFEGSEPPEL